MKEDIAGGMGVLAAVLAFVEMFIGQVDPVYLLICGSVLLGVAIVTRRRRCNRET